MSDEVFAVPVKYMVIEGHSTYHIIDTSYEGNGQIICSSGNLSDAHHVTKVLNEYEGFQYAY